MCSRIFLFFLLFAIKLIKCRFLNIIETGTASQKVLKTFIYRIEMKRKKSSVCTENIFVVHSTAKSKADGIKIGFLHCDKSTRQLAGDNM